MCWVSRHLFNTYSSSKCSASTVNVIAQAWCATVCNGVQYRNPWNRVRVGRLLEDMDSLAGYVAFLHCDDGDGGRLPPLLVTAAVERIAILQPVALERDATLRAPRCSAPRYP